MLSYYELTFGTDLDLKVKVRVPNANQNPGPYDVSRAMNKIKLANAFLPKYGNITEKLKAELFCVETSEFNVK